MHFDVPASRQCCPTSAACWSTHSPVTAIEGPKASVRPISCAQPTTAGRSSPSSPKTAQACSDQLRRSRSSSNVLEAVVTSVTKAPVSRWRSHESVVVTTPDPVTLRRSHFIFGAAK